MHFPNESWLLICLTEPSREAWSCDGIERERILETHLCHKAPPAAASAATASAEHTNK